MADYASADYASDGAGTFRNGLLKHQFRSTHKSEMVVAAAHVNPGPGGNPNKSLTTGGCEGVQVKMRPLGAG